MNDKQQLAAMGGHLAEQPICLQKRVEQLEGEVRILAGLLREAIGDVPQTQSFPSRCDAALSGNLPEPRITKRARVWGALFMPGVTEKAVIDAAYRYAEHEASDKEKQAGKTNFDLLMAAVHKTVPEGWQLVPVKLTPKMWDAMNAGYQSPACQWDAALAAAPKPGDANA